VILPAAARAAGFSLLSLGSVDSTNRFALDGAGTTFADRTWIVAREQSGGRGRHGRAWASPPGNLYATLLLIDPCTVALSPRLGFVAGAATADAAREGAPGADVRLKWPNDLIVGEAKLSGILLEGRMLAGGRQAVAIGVGMNVAHAPDIPGRRATCLRELGGLAHPEAVFKSLASAVALKLELFRRGEGFPDIRVDWLRRALPIGAALGVKLHDREVAGAFAGIDAEGRLALDTPGGLVHVEAGDVFLAGQGEKEISRNGR
jgi:BirA family biotin operon repressor/biotin-[acetyl-CoA-carboxylase] ligase